MNTQPFNHFVDSLQNTYVTWKRKCSQMHHTDKYSQHRSIIWPVWLNGWVFVSEQSGCGFEFSYSDLNFRYCTYSKQGVPWHSGNCRMCIHSDMHMWHNKKIQSIHWRGKWSEHNSFTWPVWINGWVFLYELSGYGFESHWSHINSCTFHIHPRCYDFEYS